MARELKISITGDDGVEQVGVIQEESLPVYKDLGWAVVEDEGSVAATPGADATTSSPVTAPALPKSTTSKTAPAPSDPPA